MPSDALETLGLSYGDLLSINAKSYSINETNPDEPYTLGLPNEVKQALNLKNGDSIQNSRLDTIFSKSLAHHTIGEIDNITLIDNFIITDTSSEAVVMDIEIDNKSYGHISGCFENNQTYKITYNDSNL